ncbi:lachesin-like isoform X3 [Pogonomyrmex barbatus]|uniref:Lachesin-like isoform X3 n=1 Tax=Pogonomyrmex barbatus TaxID=144034 RepID=A0A8N1S464_9HYME|nr:lachesin-like isoform X3 [Pogonomyrmex barbatus]
MAYGLPYGMASRNVALCVLIIAFFRTSLGQTPPKSEILPEFLALLENHTVTQGRDVSFTCVVNHLQSYKVAWIKSDSRAILAIHTHMVAHNPRLSVTHNGHNTWKLHVTNVQPNDSGTYMCQVNTDPMRSQTGHMKVVIPPDIMDLDDTADMLTAKENGDLLLRCRATGNPEPVVVWRREDGRNITLRNENHTKQKLPLKTSTSGIKLLKGDKHNISEVTINDYAYQLNLTVRRLDKSDFGTYTCSAENAFGKAEGSIRLQELHISKSTTVSTRNTEIIEKHTWRKQTEKKGKKYSYIHDKGELEIISKDVSHTTPMSRRNSSSLPNIANKSRISAFPAPAPAHLTPTHLGAQNGVKSSRDHTRSCYVYFAMVILVIFARN